MNISTSLNYIEKSAVFSEFRIFLENINACYETEQTINGLVRICVATISAPLEIVDLKLEFNGSINLKKLSTKERSDKHPKQIYIMKDELDLINQGENEKTIQMNETKQKSFSFEKKLEKELFTSIESKNASIFYSIRAICTYKTEANEFKKIHAVRGITIVERFDLNLLKKSKYFEAIPYSLVRKFGLFSCTGGHIRLNFSINRCAFVCGENIVIEGKIENKTDRRVDKVAVILQQIVVIYGYDLDGSSKNCDMNIFDVCDIHEDNLALFVDEGCSVKIERNFGLPALPPSTLTLEGIEPSCLKKLSNGENCIDSMNWRRRVSRGLSLSMNTQLSFSSNKSTSSILASKINNRYLKIMYQLSVRVKTGGVEVMEINVPIVIGSIPFNDTIKQIKNDNHLKINKIDSTDSLPFKNVMYLQSRKDRQISLTLPNEIYLCNKAQLSFTNKYPYFGDLPTSSKQSRKVSILFSNALKMNDSTFSIMELEKEASFSSSSSKMPQKKPIFVKPFKNGSSRTKSIIAQNVPIWRVNSVDGAQINGLAPVQILVNNQKKK